VLHIGDPIVPFELEFLGLPGCTLYHAPLVALGSRTGATGMASLRLRVIPNTAPIGHRFEAQWINWDPSANSFGVSFSDALAFVIGG
jgi:hypothetical protein